MELDINLVIQLYDQKIMQLTHELTMKEAEVISYQREVSRLNKELQQKGSEE